MMKLGIVIGSIRQNRQTTKEAAWVFETAKRLEDVKPEVVDLKDYPLPLFDEPISPRYNPDRKIAPEVKPWLDKLNEFDAYVFVTPEYNHSIPGVLKNAIDYLTWELNRKPVAVVAHGTVGGARAALDLKKILTESRAVPISATVTLAGMSEIIDNAGNLKPEVRDKQYGPQTALDTLLNDLKWFSDALSVARSKDQ